MYIVLVRLPSYLQPLLAFASTWPSSSRGPSWCCRFLEIPRHRHSSLEPSSSSHSCFRYCTMGDCNSTTTICRCQFFCSPHARNSWWKTSYTKINKTRIKKNDDKMLAKETNTKTKFWRDCTNTQKINVRTELCTFSSPPPCFFALSPRPTARLSFLLCPGRLFADFPVESKFPSETLHNTFFCLLDVRSPWLSQIISDIHQEKKKFMYFKKKNQD